jgi:hypothetical protein
MPARASAAINAHAAGGPVAKMKKDRDSHIENAFVAARDLAALQHERRRWHVPEPIDRRAAVVSARRAVHATISSLLSRAGVDIDRFEETRAANEAALARAGEEALAVAVKQSALETRRLHGGIEQRRTLWEAVAPIDPTVPNPKRVLINTPFLIWPTLDVFFESSEIKPAGSWAKFRVDSSDDGAAEMSFYYLWENDTDKYTVINVNGYLVLSGHVRVHSGGGFFADNRHSSVTVDANLHFLEWWNQPPTQQTASQEALRVSTSSGDMFDDGSSNAGSIFRGFDVSHTARIVPPRGVVVLEMAAGVRYSNHEGTVAVDFASGDFQAISPAVLVTILT